MDKHHDMDSSDVKQVRKIMIFSFYFLFFISSLLYFAVVCQFCEWIRIMHKYFVIIDKLLCDHVVECDFFFPSFLLRILSQTCYRCCSPTFT